MSQSFLCLACCCSFRISRFRFVVSSSHGHTHTKRPFCCPHVKNTHTQKVEQKHTHTRSVTQTQAKKTIPHVGLCSPSLQAAGLHTHAASQFIATPHPSTPQQRAPATLTLPPLLPPPPPPPPALDDPACSTCDHSATTPTLTTISCNDERLLALPRSEC